MFLLCERIEISQKNCNRIYCFALTFIYCQYFPMRPSLFCLLSCTLIHTKNCQLIAITLHAFLERIEHFNFTLIHILAWSSTSRLTCNRHKFETIAFCWYCSRKEFVLIETIADEVINIWCHTILIRGHDCISLQVSSSEEMQYLHTLKRHCMIH